jgi:hypothetical protein
MPSLSRRAFALAGVSAFAGCTGLSNSLGGGSSSRGRTDAASGSADRSAATGNADASTASTAGAETEAGTEGADDSEPPLANGRLHVPVPMEELRQAVLSGGPGKDGIPSIDEPTFTSASEAPGLLGPDSIVFGVARNGVVKAYPQYVLVWHEIANDTLGDLPVSVTYCPLTGTTQGFYRGETTFGVSGNLVNSNLVVYDRGTDSRWPQMLATAISGSLAGRSLREFPLTWTTWGRWKREHPETQVLTEETGYVRDYGRDPYGSYAADSGYYADRGTLFAPLRENDRYHPKAVVVGARTTDGAIAFYEPALRKQGLLEGVPSADAGPATTTGTTIATDGTSEANGTSGADGGSETAGRTSLVATYDPVLDGATVYRNPEGIAFEYREGRVVGPDGDVHAPDALPLEEVMGYDAMWFSWAGFYPNTAIVE